MVQGRADRQLWPQVEYRLLDVEREPLAGLPADYVAVKAYFNEVLPGSEENRAFFRSVIERLAERMDVVLLSTGLLVDDHEEWATATSGSTDRAPAPAGGQPGGADSPISHAAGLVATYGGFSTSARSSASRRSVYAVRPDCSLHLEVLRRALPDADYERMRTDGDVDSLGLFASRAVTS